MYGLPKGVWLNNLFNLKKSENHWRGKVYSSADPIFEQFQTLGDGVHAGITTLINYRKLHGLQTITQIIRRWAPVEDNNPTGNYVHFVAKHCGVDSDDQYDVRDAGKLFKLSAAIIEFEQGAEEFVPVDVLKVEIKKTIG